MAEFVTLKITGLENVRKRLDPKRVIKASQIAINRSIKSVRTEASNQVRNVKGWKIKKADLDKRMDIHIYRSSHTNPFEAVLEVSRIGRMDSIALPYFGAKHVRHTGSGVRITQRRKGAFYTKLQKRSKAGEGVVVQVKRGGKKAYYPGAFIARMKSGHWGVYRRIRGVSSGLGEGANSREKIREVKTVSAVTMVAGVMPQLVAHARKRWEIEIKAQLAYQMRLAR